MLIFRQACRRLPDASPRRFGGAGAYADFSLVAYPARHSLRLPGVYALRRAMLSHARRAITRRRLRPDDGWTYAPDFAADAFDDYRIPQRCLCLLPRRSRSEMIRPRIRAITLRSPPRDYGISLPFEVIGKVTQAW
jgi:hypothetical protein